MNHLPVAANILFANAHSAGYIGIGTDFKGSMNMSRAIGMICLCLGLVVCAGCGAPEGGSGNAQVTGAQ